MVVVDGVLPPTVFRGLRICGALKPWNVPLYYTVYRLWGVVKPRNLSKGSIYYHSFPCLLERVSSSNKALRSKIRKHL